MKQLVKKNLQILPEFDEALARLGHGQLQEAVNAALTMFFMARINEKRYWIRLFRELKDGEWIITPHPSGHGASLSGSPDDPEFEAWRKMKEKLYAGPPTYFDPGSILSLPDDLRAEKWPAHLAPVVPPGVQGGEPDAAKEVRKAAAKKPRIRQRRKEA